MKSMRLLTAQSGKQMAIDPTTVTMLIEGDGGVDIYTAGDADGVHVRGTIRDVARRLDIHLIER